MEVKEIKNILKGIKSITLSKHFSEKATIRKISVESVIKHLQNSEDLVYVEEQDTNEKEGNKYGLLFKYMSNYDLKVVVSIKDEGLNIITAHIQNIKRRKVYKKWLGDSK